VDVLLQFELLAVTVYVPVAADVTPLIEGFEIVAVNPLGPVHGIRVRVTRS
jgi:hypothetical protein